MARRILASHASASTAQARRGHPLLESILDTIDRHLRRRLEVGEYSHAPACIFRLRILRCSDDLVLSDGTQLRPGDPIVDLHFWNEQIPRMPPAGPTLSWAHQFLQSLAFSLRELADYLSRRPDLSDAIALRANIALGPAAQHARIIRLVRRLGFEVVRSDKPRSIAQHLHRFGENLFISLLVLARNAPALRADSMRREHVIAYLSRRTLDERFGSSSVARRHQC